MPPPRLIAWDFDGVLNRNVVDGRFVWSDELQADLGLDPDELHEFLFASGRMKHVVRGDEDVLSALDQWLTQIGSAIKSETLLAYWFEKDARPDPELIVLLSTLSCRHIIATNNEARRASYIATEMGFGDIVEEVFASGRLGFAKPEAAFFDHIQSWSGLQAEEILLIDDTPQNIAAASGFGWQTLLVTAPRQSDLASLIKKVVG